MSSDKQTFGSGYIQMDNTRFKAVYTTSGNNNADGYELPAYNTLNEASMVLSAVKRQSEPRSYEMLHQTKSGEPILSAKCKARSRPPNHKRQCILGTVIAVIGLAIIVACCVVPTLVFSRHVDSRIQAEMNLFRYSAFRNPAKSPSPTDQAVADLRVVINGTCYCLFTEGRNWYNAREFCLFLRGVSNFAEIHDKETNSFLMPILKAIEPNPAIWIGGSDLNAEGVFKWNSSELEVKTFSPTQWDFGEPSHEYNGNPEHCIELANHKSFVWVSWNDDNCNIVKPFLCQSIMTADGRCGC